MFKNAFIPLMNVVPAAGTTSTVGSPTRRPLFPPVLYPAGWASIPAKIAARTTEMNVKRADRVASFERVSKVLGKEQKKHTTPMMAAKPTVHSPPPVMVLRYSAPTST